MKKQTLTVTTLLLSLLFIPCVARAQIEGPVSLTTSGATCQLVSNVTCAILPISGGQNTILFNIIGAAAGTNVFEFSPDNQVTWRALTVVNLVSLSAVTSTTAAGTFTVTNPGYTHVRVRMSVTGTNTTLIRALQNNSMVGVNFGGGGTIGSVTQGLASDASANWLVNCAVGCSAITTDPDDASIAAGQTNSNSNALNMVYDGSVWRRLTIGTAGTASAQVLTIQGIASGTVVPISGSLTNISGTISLPTGAATAAKQPALGTAGTASSDVISIQGIASGTIVNTQLPAAAAGADNMANPTAPFVLSANMCWDSSGSNWDRCVPSALVAGSAIIGKVGIDQTTPGTTNLVQVTDGAGALNTIVDSGTITTVSTVTNLGTINSVAPAFNTGINGATVLRVNEATDSQMSAGIGATGDAAATVGSTGSAAAKLRLVTSQLDAITTAVQLIDDDQTGDTPYFLTSAASTNSTSVKASAGRLMSLQLINTTATLYYLRLYNLGAGPTCSSATGFISSYPVPAATTGDGIVANFGPTGIAFGTGIAFCFTGGGSSTDNTNAATGVYIHLQYK